MEARDLIYAQIVERHSATLAGVVEEVLRADHCQMVKFSNRNQNDYQAVLSYLVDWMKGAASEVEKKWSVEDIRRGLERIWLLDAADTRLDPQKGDPPSAPDINLPKPLPPVSRSYIERRDIQASMSQKLLPSEGKRHQPRCILHGMGGAGKTQLATNWIREHEHK